MGKSLKMSLLLAATLIAGSVIRAEVTVPKVFGNHMVLQQNRPLPVWGWAKPGEKVSVTLGDNSAQATATAKGEWRVSLPAMPAGGPLSMTVKGSNTLSFTDILVGEVWLCSGQSNMEFSMRGCLSAQTAIPKANFPKIRLFKIPRTNRGYPEKDVQADWQVCDPQTVAGFSAVGYMYGRELHQKLNIPVGLISSSWGGTRIEPWTPPVGFAQIPKLAAIHEQVELCSPWTQAYKKRLASYMDELGKWQTETKAALTDELPVPPQPAFPNELKIRSGRQDPVALYNGMIHPIVPFPIRGAIWYQGESNRHDGKIYFEKMQALIAGWRSIWNDPEMPFYFVQLAPFRYGGSAKMLPRIWEAQTRAAREIPHCGMAIINDIGNLGDIHPRNKKDVANRLALLALNNTYNKNLKTWSGPLAREIAIEGNKIRVTFDYCGFGLISRDGKPLSHFEIVDVKKGYLKAKAEIVADNQVIVSSPEATEVSGVRFAWDQLATPNLMNKAGLPAGAFRLGKMFVRNDLQERIPEAEGYQVLYRLDIPVDCGYSTKPVKYLIDKTAEMKDNFRKVAYCLELRKKGEETKHIFVAMDSFTKDTKQLGVPTVASKNFFQTKVKNLKVASNVKGVPVGNLGEGNIEFWPSNYGGQNSARIPNASNSFDFGDGGGRAATAGYGSMQIHSFPKKSVLLAFNRWGPDGTCELGIGNCPNGNLDWTFTSNAQSYEFRRLTILVQIEE